VNRLRDVDDTARSAFSEISGATKGVAPFHANQRNEPEERRSGCRAATHHSRREYLAAFDDLTQRSRRALRIFDSDGAQLALNRPACADRLRTFLLASRDNRLLVALHSVDHLRKHCPRFIALVAQFSFAISVHQTEDQAARAEDCFVLADTEHFVRRPVATAARGGYAINEAREAREIRGRFDEIWQSSFPAVTAATLGL
jgi:hypothetical protein